MKRNYKRFFTIFVSLVILLSVCFSVLGPVTFAKSKDPIPDKGSAKDGGLTYTEALRAINENLKKDGYWKEHTKNLKKPSTYDKAAAKAVTGAYNILKDPANADYIGVGFDVLTGAVNAIAAAYGLGGLSDAAFGIISDMAGGQSLSETQKLQQHLDSQFDEVHDHLDDIQDDIGELSNQVDKQTAEIIEALYGAFAAQEAKDEVESFFSSDGNFDYDLFKNYLYGSTKYVENSDFMYAYCNILIETIVDENSSNEDIKRAYDNLYKALMLPNSNGSSYMRTFYDEVISDKSSGEKSIQQYYYDYLSSNKEFLNGKNAEYEAFMFALDIYSTALYAESRIFQCHLYQYLQLQFEYGDSISDNTYYKDSEGHSLISYGELKQYIEAETSTNLVKLEAQLASDVAYFLNIESSFTAELPSKEIMIMNNFGNDTYGNVIPGETVYLNVLPEDFCAYFDLDASKFSFAWNSGYTDLKTQSAGFVVTNDCTTFTGSVLYDGVEVYSIDFAVPASSDFVGGSGSANDPYLISNEEQLKSISTTENGLDSHYILINDITITSPTFDVIGSQDDPFTGSFDGNGYSIKNMTIDSQSANTGIFGSLEGTVKNLTLKDCSVFAQSYSDDEKVYVGVIAGTNYGTIENCRIEDSTITIIRNTTVLNKNITSYAGGICGYSAGNIKQCRLEEGVKINASCTRNYSAEPDGDNQHYLNAGGITGFCDNGNIESSYFVGSISAYAKSIVEPGMHTRHPYIKVYVGGITARQSNAIIEKVFADPTVTQCSYELDRSGWAGDLAKNNCEAAFHSYIVDCEDDYIEKISQAKDDIIFPSDNGSTSVSFSFKNSEGNEITKETEFGLYPNQVYDCGAKNLNLEGLILSVNGNVIKDYTIISYYFDSINSSKAKDINSIAKILFLDNGTSNLHMLEMPVVIRKNKPVELVLSVPPLKLSYELNEQFSFDGAAVLYKYQDGSSLNVTKNLDLSKLEDITSSYGKKTVTLSYDGKSVSFEIEVVCEHSWANPSGTVIPSTCTLNGYTQFECSKCGFVEKTAFTPKKPHTLVLQDVTSSTCTAIGYSGDYFCTVCERIIEKGENLPLEKHQFSNNGNVVSHKCIVCELNEEHSFVTTENEDSVIYTCIVCDYAFTESKVLSEDTPRVVVSEAYALLGGDNLITVYVQMINNPGITGASFSVNYDERLELVEYYAADVLDSINSCKKHTDRNSFYFTMARAQVERNDGNMLKLIFRVPSDAARLDEYDISISFSRSGVQFSDENNNPIDIITVDGGITVVDHLPGDVNNDSFVDILDAVLIARYLSNYDDNTFIKKYSDIDLDGDTDITDLTRLLQNLVGGYDANAINNEYKILLNTNNGSNNLEEYEATCFDYGNTDKDGNPTRNKYMTLPTLKRDGYKFEGWYTAFSGGDLVTNDSYIYYNRTQQKQTLYARWTPNTIIFDGNGATSGQMSNVSYSESTPFVALGNNYAKFTTIFVNSGIPGSMTAAKSVTQTFLGWALDPNSTVPDYNFGYLFDLKDGEIGKLTLYAVWSTETFEMPQYTKEGSNLMGWQVFNDATGISQISTVTTRDVANGSTVFAIWAARKYSIVYYKNEINSPKSDSYYESFERSIEAPQALSKNTFSYPGYIFSGWNTQSNGKGTFFTENEVVDYINTEQNGQVELYAIWDPIEYKIRYYANTSNSDYEYIDIEYTYGISGITGSRFSSDGFYLKSWNTKRDGTGKSYSLKSEIKNETTENGSTPLVLYAQWAGNPYTISFGGATGNITYYASRTDQKITLPTPSLSEHRFVRWLSNKYSISGNTITIPANTHETINLVADWERVVYHWNSGSRELYQEEDFAPHVDTVYGAFNVERLKSLGYTKFEVTVKIDWKEHSGDEIYGRFSVQFASASESFDGLEIGDDWDSVTKTVTVDLNDVASDGSFQISCDPHDSDWSNDRFYIGTVYASIKVY